MTKPHFGFVHGHSHLDSDDVEKIREAVGIVNPSICQNFEDKFASLIGDGKSVSYAAGRMGFYELIKYLGIGEGDEVIILGATCSVMATAVIRSGAMPVYSDIDPATFGSEVDSIRSCFGKKTKMVVAQHSFGIPCNIEPIVKFCEGKGVFLLEDCALTLGSKIGKISVGNFGDAALFSIDHGKPINTMIGGLIYSKNLELIEKLKIRQESCPELPMEKQSALWSRFLFERKFYVVNRSRYFHIFDFVERIKIKFLGFSQPFLTNDYDNQDKEGYPYPAKLPTFLALLGCYEVDRWKMVEKERRENLAELLKYLRSTKIAGYLPTAYWQENTEIVPLRFAWYQENGEFIRSIFDEFVQVSWTWFMKPIISASLPLAAYKYANGCCPISEKIGPKMVNLPCNLNKSEFKQLMTIITRILDEKILPNRMV